jgi:hypothetical protein
LGGDESVLHWHRGVSGHTPGTYKPCSAKDFLAPGNPCQISYQVTCQLTQFLVLSLTEKGHTDMGTSHGLAASTLAQNVQGPAGKL